MQQVFAYNSKPIEIEAGGKSKGFPLVKVRVAGDAWSYVRPWEISDAIAVRQCYKCYEISRFAVCRCNR